VDVAVGGLIRRTGIVHDSAAEKHEGMQCRESGMMVYSIDASPKVRNKKITKEKVFVLVNANSDPNVVGSGSRLELKSAGRTHAHRFRCESHMVGIIKNTSQSVT
jgi:hypothetical protein